MKYIYIYVYILLYTDVVCSSLTGSVPGRIGHVGQQYPLGLRGRFCPPPRQDGHAPLAAGGDSSSRTFHRVGMCVHRIIRITFRLYLYNTTAERLFDILTRVHCKTRADFLLAVSCLFFLLLKFLSSSSCFSFLFYFYFPRNTVREEHSRFRNIRIHL